MGRQPAGQDGDAVIIGVQNLSTLVTDEDVYLMALMADQQLREHVASAWGLAPPMVEFLPAAPSDLALPSGAPVPHFDAIIGVLDDADQAGDLGWHTEGPDADVYGRVFASPVLQNGGNALTNALSVCSVLSHECIETLGDSACNRWSQRSDGVAIALELADPVEGDSYEITISSSSEVVTATVSNFVLPAWFDPNAEPGPTDWMGLLTAPFSVRPTGYVIEMPSGASSVTEVWGESYPAWRKATKAAPSARTARRDPLFTARFAPPTALA
jgi:hypothetical protein